MNLKTGTLTITLFFSYGDKLTFRFWDMGQADNFSVPPHSLYNLEYRQICE